MVTGGGSTEANTCRRVLESGDGLVLVDNLCRPGADGKVERLEMAPAAVVEGATRYAYRDCPHGIAETAPLDFHPPRKNPVLVT